MTVTVLPPAVFPTAGTDQEKIKRLIPKDLNFSLLPKLYDSTQLKKNILDQCHIPIEQIEDVYPCTSAQEALVALSMSNPNAYVARYVYRLATDTESTRLEAAVKTVVLAHTILRTRVIQSATQGSLQVVVNAAVRLVQAEGLDQYIQRDIQSPITPGDPLLRLALVYEPGMKETFFVVTIHHALYDDWSLNQVLHEIEAAYAEQTIVPRLFSHFTLYANQNGQSLASEQYWSNFLEGAQPCRFPQLPHDSYTPTGRSLIETSEEIADFHWPESAQTAAVELAWALTLSRYVSSYDLTFGVTFTGRRASLPGIGAMSGPTIATVPRRIRLNPTESVDATLDRLELEERHMTPFEQRGLYQIRQLGGDAATACQFNNLLVIQAPPQHKYTRMVDVTNQQESLANHATFGTYALTWVCDLRPDGVRLQAVFDDNVIPPRQMHRLMRQFVHVLKTIVSKRHQFQVEQLLGLCPEDRAELYEWNNVVPETTHLLLPELIARNCARNPDSMAVCAWDGVFRRGELHKMATRVAQRLRYLGVGSETFVPLLFNKSKWTSLAVLATLEAGAAFVLLDPSLPLHRLRTICRLMKATCIITSSDLVSTSVKLATAVIALEDESPILSEDAPRGASLGTVASHHALYGVFTSGSTGTPKGVVIEHGAFATSIKAYLEKIPMGEDVRALQFASYSFDVSVSDILLSLVSGACLCVPSESERKGALEDAVSKYNVNWADLTPSLLRRFRPEQMPSLRTVILGGEPLSGALVRTWAPHVRLLNIYGPAECCVLSTVQDDIHEKIDPRDIGVGVGTVCWVLDPDSHERLMPIGAVGELYLEGPTVGRGYLDDMERTVATFVKPPSWLKEIREDLRQAAPQNRIYKTGDLVQYTAEGSLLYVGRKDKQIKLHGQRIELGEVEFHVQNAFSSAFEVVADVVDLSDGKKLVAFVQMPGPADDDAMIGDIILSPVATWQQDLDHVQQTLRQFIPEFMIPSTFFSIAEIPVTLSGKIDRSRLQEAAAGLSREQLQNYRPGKRGPKRPVTSDMGRRIQALWAEVLRLNPDDIGADDGFFQLGGDSITAMTLSGAARMQGLSLSASDLFQNKALEEIAEHVYFNGAGKTPSQNTLIDWAAETALAPRLEGLNIFNDDSQRRPAIALTGGTGFLGNELLRQLISDDRIDRIHCLAVRNPSRIISSKKITTHLGDLSQLRLGLSPETAKDVMQSCRAIIHCGADVSFAKDYRLLHGTNVQSTREIAELAVFHGVPIHFVSTAALAHFTDGGISNGYLACKWVSEITLERVHMKYQIPVTIYRASSIVGANAPATDLTNAVLQWCRLMHSVPDLSHCPGFVDLIRVETVAADILHVVLDQPSSLPGKVSYVHESGETVFPASQLKSHIESEVGVPVHEVALSVWLKEARQRGMLDILARFLETQSSDSVDIALPQVQSRRSRAA
ncbi:nonribosomal peptide synthase [Penicillium lagena]|uniref:nonribosomal peptide synthase n=1 Tax=Penicillium lagena TaxID=94218 RepID=UPI0025418B18|nr:nonribosomal peptide synthase [Penicillium lagena]KAJ5610822.1 nonribosomal peptide synthase [Penicillium lagena]